MLTPHGCLVRARLCFRGSPCSLPLWHGFAKFPVRGLSSGPRVAPSLPISPPGVCGPIPSVCSQEGRDLSFPHCAHVGLMGRGDSDVVGVADGVTVFLERGLLQGWVFSEASFPILGHSPTA